MDKTLVNLKRKLEKMELEHLRKVVVSQGMELDRVYEQLAMTKNLAENEESISNFWCQQFENLMSEIGEKNWKVGVTKEGEIHLKRESK